MKLFGLALFFATSAFASGLPFNWQRAIDLTVGRTYQFTLKSINLSQYPMNNPRFQVVFVACNKDKCATRGSSAQLYSRYIMRTDASAITTGQLNFGSDQVLEVKGIEENFYLLQSLVAEVYTKNTIEADLCIGVRIYDYQNWPLLNTFLAEKTFYLTELHKGQVIPFELKVAPENFKANLELQVL